MLPGNKHAFIRALPVSAGLWCFRPNMDALCGTGPCWVRASCPLPLGFLVLSLHGVWSYVGPAVRSPFLKIASPPPKSTVTVVRGLARVLVRTLVMTWVRALRRGTGAWGGDVHCAKEMWNEINSLHSV